MGVLLFTKDSDFVVSHLLQGIPPRLLLVSTGNIANDDLTKLFVTNLAALEHAFTQHDFIEFGRSSLIIHQ